MNDLRNQFETNFFGLVDFTKKVLPLMLQRREIGSRIVNVSLLAGLVSFPLIGAYSALEAIFDALRMELWNTNIKVITIDPGVIETSIYETLKQKINGYGTMIMLQDSFQHITNILRKGASKD